MSQNISILQIDQNPSGWISQFLTANNQAVTNTIQDKITTLYLLQNSRLLVPVSLDDIFQISSNFIQGIILANKQSDQGDKTNRLVALVLLYNLGAVNPADSQYITNPRFNEVFLSNTSLTGNNVRSALTPKPSVSILPLFNPSQASTFKPITVNKTSGTAINPVTNSSPNASVPIRPSTTSIAPIRPSTTSIAPIRPSTAAISPIRPSTAAISPIRPSTAAISPIKPSTNAITPVYPLPEGIPQFIPSNNAITLFGQPPQFIGQEDSEYHVCEHCGGHSYNNEGFCEQCEDDREDEIMYGIQVEHYIDTDPDYVNHEDYYYSNDEDEDYNEDNNDNL